MESRIVEVVDEHLDAMARTGAPADLVASFALPIPSLVICELLGVPYAERDGFQRRSLRQLDLALPPWERQAVADEGRSYMRSLVERARRNPGDDLIGTLVRDHGEGISDEELAGIGALLLLAGHETTSNMLALGTLALLQHPEQLAAVRDNPDAVGPAVEELLRYASIVRIVGLRLPARGLRGRAGGSFRRRGRWPAGSFRRRSYRGGDGRGCARRTSGWGILRPQGR